MNEKELILSQESIFDELANSHKAVKFKSECEFALMSLNNNNYLAGIAKRNPESLKSAIKQVASIGVSLNQSQKHAYLVPRDGRVCLDISYMGLCHLAIESGSIIWVKAELVKKKDTFTHHGPGIMPIHSYDPFSKDRGETIGAYCVAKLSNGDYLTEIMSIEEINTIKNRSPSAKGKNSPWKTDEGEMQKKTVIKRAAKLWPQSSKRLNSAIEVVNEHQGVNMSKEQPEAIVPTTNIEKLEIIENLVAKIGKTEDGFLSYFKKVIKRDVESIELLTDKECDRAISQLEVFCENSK